MLTIFSNLFFSNINTDNVPENLKYTITLKRTETVKKYSYSTNGGLTYKPVPKNGKITVLIDQIIFIKPKNNKYKSYQSLINEDNYNSVNNYCTIFACSPNDLLNYNNSIKISMNESINNEFTKTECIILSSAFFVLKTLLTPLFFLTFNYHYIINNIIYPE